MPVNHKIIKSATGESQIVEKQALITRYVQGEEIEITVLVVRKLVYGIILEVDKLSKLHATIAVSYTHLDVYKRQVDNMIT